MKHGYAVAGFNAAYIAAASRLSNGTGRFAPGQNGQNVQAVQTVSRVRMLESETFFLNHGKIPRILLGVTSN
jgi:hypothetical protein